MRVYLAPASRALSPSRPEGASFSSTIVWRATIVSRYDLLSVSLLRHVVSCVARLVSIVVDFQSTRVFVYIREYPTYAEKEKEIIARVASRVNTVLCWFAVKATGSTFAIVVSPRYVIIDNILLECDVVYAGSSVLSRVTKEFSDLFRVQRRRQRRRRAATERALLGLAAPLAAYFTALNSYADSAREWECLRRCRCWRVPRVITSVIVVIIIYRRDRFQPGRRRRRQASSFASPERTVSFPLSLPPSPPASLPLPSFLTSERSWLACGGFIAKWRVILSVHRAAASFSAKWFLLFGDKPPLCNEVLTAGLSIIYQWAYDA